jgi:hypothetical protein
MTDGETIHEFRKIAERSELLAKLRKRFGAGQDRQKRDRLYEKVVDAIGRHGVECYRLVAGVAAEAASASHPDRYFCFVVLRRLAEHGFLDAAEL